MYKKIIAISISFLFVFEPAILNATTVGIGTESRTQEVATDIMKSDRPSELPVAGYSEFFEKEQINIIKNIDLSNYPGLKIFAGYGIFDSTQDNCHYIEVPGKTKFDFENNFKDFSTYNKHSYGISKNRMTYSQCFALSAEFGGTPVVIDSGVENYFIRTNYTNNGNVWVGATINDCSSIYESATKRTQFYLNFKEDEVCSEFKKNVSMNSKGFWDRSSENELFSCVVEWDSLTYLRPIKVCAPWWKVYREYENNNIGLVSQRELNRINQADLPAKLDVCTMYSEKAVEDLNNSVPRDVTCTSYLSATIAPECFYNKNQEQCEVDECGGYIKNACREKASEIVGKGYVKGQVIHDGVKVSIKVKDQVKTHVYTCPPSPPSNKECLAQSNVLIYPKECPGSNCEALKACLYAAIEDEDIDKCEEEYTCTKIYADRSIPPLLSPEGVVMKLYGMCPDGTMLEFEPNILDKTDRTCLEYEQIKVTKNEKQKCIINRTYTEHEVNLAFNEVDEYQDNENCIRIDTIEDNQVNTPVNIDITLNGYFKNKVTKLYAADKNDFVSNAGTDSEILNLLMSGRGSLSGTTDSVENKDNKCEINLDCTKYFSSEYQDRNNAVLLDGSNRDPNISKINIEENTFVKIYDLNSTECSSYSEKHDFKDYEKDSNYFVDSETGQTTCLINLIDYPEDSNYKSIKLVGTSLNYERKENTTKDECLRNSVCLSSTFNENNYEDDYSSIGVCSMVTGSVPSSYMDYLLASSGCTVTPAPAINEKCEPNSRNETVYSQMNGFESILAFEDYIGGEFGYYSNFISTLPKSNFIKITTDELTDKEVFPLVNISNIADYEKYVTGVLHTGYKSKQANTAGQIFIAVFGAVGSMDVGGILGVITGGLAYVIVALITPSRDMDAQDQTWVIYKSIPEEVPHGKFENREKIEKTIETPFNGPTVKADGKNWEYLKETYSIPKMDSWDYVLSLLKIYDVKKRLLTCSGYDKFQVEKMTLPTEHILMTGHPGCKWYDLFCEKADLFVFTDRVDVNKPVNTIYSGADETVTFLVPYKGNFRFKAYDKYDTVIGDLNITSDSFLNMSTPTKVVFAQVKFGNKMQLAPGVDREIACRDDYMVEWGGGVSGAYYENNTTSSNVGCAKSNDEYVNDHAAVKIEVIPENMENASFVLRLEKPLPFANRIFIGTLNKEQKRKYRCYEDFQDCGEKDFKEVE